MGVKREALRHRGATTAYEACCEVYANIGTVKATECSSTDAAVRLQLTLIWEELHELEEALAEGHAPHVRKELCDLLDVCHGLGYVLSLDVDADYSLVTASNLSKLHTTEEQLRATRTMYGKLGVDTIVVTTAPNVHVVKSAKRQVASDGKHYPEGKWLKSAHYTTFEELLKRKGERID